MLEPALLDDARLDATQRQLLTLTDRLLAAIQSGDDATYVSLCLPELSCFEDIAPYRVDGVEFHRHLVRRAADHPESQPVRQDMLNPRVQVYENCGIVTYTRLCTYEGPDGPYWRAYNETRVYICVEGRWRMAHFHRSPAPVTDGGAAVSR